MSSQYRPKVFDLRLTELRTELENRELDSAGKKAGLVVRLKNALQEEGHDPETYVFEDRQTAFFSSISKEISQVSSDVLKVSTEITSLENKVSSEISQVSTDITSLENKVSSEISQVSSDILKVSTDITSLENKISKVSGDISSLESDSNFADEFIISRLITNVVTTR
uniref:SAFB-like transcription modulator n=1 Tax=Diabrotica virgifera virgifera TaxID=50390 RepID=A0A6P7GSV6_DIAVI